MRVEKARSEGRIIRCIDLVNNDEIFTSDSASTDSWDGRWLTADDPSIPAQ
jgi:hypothetical protein